PFGKQPNCDGGSENHEQDRRNPEECAERCRSAEKERAEIEPSGDQKENTDHDVRDRRLKKRSKLSPCHCQCGAHQDLSTMSFTRPRPRGRWAKARRPSACGMSPPG